VTADLASQTAHTQNLIIFQIHGLWPCDPKSFERSGVLLSEERAGLGIRGSPWEKPLPRIEEELESG
jgi:ribonuclease I